MRLAVDQRFNNLKKLLTFLIWHSVRQIENSVISEDSLRLLKFFYHTNLMYLQITSPERVTLVMSYATGTYIFCYQGQKSMVNGQKQFILTLDF